MTAFRTPLMVAVGVAATLLAGSLTSRAQTAPQMCGERSTIIEGLQRDFKEQPAAVGVVNASAVVEVFVSDQGTWTIIATGADGKSCLISAGENWQGNLLMVGEGA